VYAGLNRGFQQIQSIAEVLAEVEIRVLHRFADQRIGREMHDRADRPASEYVAERLPVFEIPFNELRPLWYRLAMATAEIVKDANLIASRQELLGADAADVAGAAGDKNHILHRLAPSARAAASASAAARWPAGVKWA